MRRSSALPAVKPVLPGLRRAVTHGTKPPPFRQDRTETDRQTERGREALLWFALLLPSSPGSCSPRPLQVRSMPPTQLPAQFRSLTAKKKTTKQNEKKTNTTPHPSHPSPPTAVAQRGNPDSQEGPATFCLLVELRPSRSQAHYFPVISITSSSLSSSLELHPTSGTSWGSN